MHSKSFPALARWLGLAAIVTAGLVSLVGSGGGGGEANISGIIDFQSVPNETASNGRLLYGSTVNKPARGITVEVVPAGGGAPLATTTTSSNGTYSLSIASGQSVVLRIRAEMVRSASTGGSWNYTVLDNTQGDALYVYASAAFTPAAGPVTQNLRASSGWGGSSYIGTRAAAPFAILDTLYDATQKVLTVAPNTTFPALQLMWSVNNRPAAGDPANGFIGTSSYDRTTRRISVLGLADTDTDEYDRTVIAHEFGHYLQDTFSRDDNVGGPHASGDRLDMRVAFSEGWGNAWSGMALATQYYTDSVGPQQALGGRTDLAAAPVSNRGWFSESTVQYLMYQWHANAAIGFAPIWTVMTGFPANLPAQGALSSLHAFAHLLKQVVPAQATAINTLLAGQLVTVDDALGTAETNNGGIPLAVPLYRNHIAALGAAQQYCVTDAAGTAGDESNKLGSYVFVRIPLAAAAQRTFTVDSLSLGSDPDFRLYRPDGTFTAAQADGATETMTLNAVGGGTHILVLVDYALTRGPSAGTLAGQRCFNVKVQ